MNAAKSRENFLVSEEAEWIQIASDGASKEGWV